MEDVSFFLGCLSNYLRENNFYIGFDFSSFERVKSDAALAEEAFETYRKRGYALDQAMELTMNDLFANVGESRHQAIETCLIGILGIHDLTEVEEEFVQKTAIQGNGVFEGIKEFRYGLDPASLDENYDEFRKRVSDAYVNRFSVSVYQAT